MTLGRKKSVPTNSLPTPLSSMPPSYSSAPPQAASQVRDQIARLQQRQMEMVQQTSLELEDLKQRLEHNEETEWLRIRVNELEQEKQVLQDSFEQQLSSFRNVIRGQARAIDQQIQIFSLDATQNLESMLGALQSEVPRVAVKPEYRPAPQVVATPPTFADFVDMPNSFPVQPPQPVQMTDVRPVKQKRKNSFRIVPGRKVVIRLAALALIGATGYWGFNQFLAPKSVINSTAQVAGVSTASQVVEDPYAASFAEYPFNQTAWENHIDPDFGLAIDWPSNTSNRVRVVGGNNLWFLRKNGFLIQVTRLDAGTALDLDIWWSHKKTEFEDAGKVSKTTFKGMPTMYVEATAITPTSGNSYFIKRTSGIFHIWVKNEPASTDDGQRIARMLFSLTFTN